jgi:aryl-alcohol dehydrogenase-like predicted oxidoreductase
VEYRNLGRTGLKVSALCLGTMQFGWTADESTSFEVLSAAYESGVNFIDTANVYSRWVEGNPGGVSETIIGRWMKGAGIPRERLVIATKVRGRMGDGPNEQGLSRAHIFQAVDGSLKRLDTDYIDLYQTHYFDVDTAIDETLSAMDDLVRMGKVRYIGCSNYPAWRLMEALWTSDRLKLVRFDSLQPHYNLAHRGEYEAELEEVCLQFGIGVIPYSPLAAGFLTGKYQPDGPSPESGRKGSVEHRYFNPKGWGVLDAIREVSQAAEGRSMSRVSLAWLLARPGITSPIIGPRSLDQLADNLGAVDVELTAEEISLLDRASG